MSERFRKRVALEHLGKIPHEVAGSVRYVMGDGNYLSG